MSTPPATAARLAPAGNGAGPGGDPRIPAALQADAVMAQAGAENFPVASRFLGRAARTHLLALYGFARLVDDIGDEAPGDRGALLDWLEADLRRVYGAGTSPQHPLMARLRETVRACTIPPEPFERLIAANRQDQVVTTYATIEDLYAYCELSANPVGHLVLHVFGAATPERLELSDRVCTGLQLVEHWQDVGEDLDRGRVYLPQEDMARFACDVEDLRRRPTPGGVRRLLAFECERARDLLDAGVPLARSLHGRPRLAVCAFTAGGRAALDALRRADHDVLGARPRPSAAAKARSLAATIAATIR